MLPVTATQTHETNHITPGYCIPGSIFPVAQFCP